jgi:molybdopterin molybdotransferase
MPEFLELVLPQEALDKILSNLSPIKISEEIISTIEALGRVTSQSILSTEALPAFPRSTVDGYAVHARDTYGASDTLPAYLMLVGEVLMGKAPTFSLGSGEAALIHTGGMLPGGADAVVMLEQVQAAGKNEIEVSKAAASGENTLKAGEDVTPGQEVVGKGVRLRPAEIGGLLALGILSVPVVKLPRVGILSSGDEVVQPEETPAPGQVRDINSFALSALIQQHGGCPVRYGVVPDQADALENLLRKALDQNDLVVITAGSSASVRDFTAEVIDRMGKPGVLVHGVNIRPGKPTILAVCDSKAVIGLPGNPVSALVIAGLFVKPVLDHLLGITSPRAQPVVKARLSINLSSQAGREDWIPAKLIKHEDEFIAEPIFFKSNLIFTLAKADGLISIPAAANGISQGELVDVYLI